jgi:hypothetical protein
MLRGRESAERLTFLETTREWLRTAKQAAHEHRVAAARVYIRPVTGVVDELASVAPAAATPTVRRRPRTPVVLTVGLLGAWVAIVTAGRLVFERLQADGAGYRIDAGPLHGFIDPRITPRLLLPATVAVAVLVVAPRAVRLLAWTGVVAVSGIVAAVWAVSLALVDGRAGLTEPLASSADYLAAVPDVGSWSSFLSTFVDRIASYPVHVQGHPPGAVLLLDGLSAFGLGGTGPAAFLFIAGGAVAVPAVLVTVREVAGERVARRGAPFIVLAPVAIWVASSADALYAGVGAWAVALIVVATGRDGLRADLLALAGGLLFGLALFLSYGLVLLALVPAIVAWNRGRLRTLVVATGGIITVFAAFAAAGFWWFSGLMATRERYLAGVASDRPYVEFLFINAAAISLALGPALAVAIARLRDHRLAIIVGASLSAIAVAMLSGMSKGEVERIWLPFAVFVLPAAATLAGGRETVFRGWLAVQAGAALVTAGLVRTSW